MSDLSPGKAFGLVITSDQQVVVQEVLIDPAGGASRAHSTMASSQLANMWTFSGGSTETGMSTFLTVANPSASNSTVTATYYFHDGSASIFENMVVSAGRRGTFASSASITAGRTFGVIITAAGGNIVAQQVVYDEVRGRAFSSSGSWGP